MTSGTIPIALRVRRVPEIVEGTFAEKMFFTAENADEMMNKTECVLTLSKKQIGDIGLRAR